MGIQSIFANSVIDNFGPGILLSRDHPIRPGTEYGFFDEDESRADFFSADEDIRASERDLGEGRKPCGS
jgi:hypothetical protein